MGPEGLNSSERGNVLCYHLTDWARKDGTGVVYGPAAGYRLPNGAIRGPDASWVRRDRLAPLSKDELEKVGPLCSGFLAEGMSPSDKLNELSDKKAEYIGNG